MGFHKLVMKFYILVERTQIQDLNIAQQYGLDGIISGGIVVSTRYVNLKTSKVSFSNRHKKLVSASIVKNSCERFNFYLGQAPRSFRMEFG